MSTAPRKPDFVSRSNFRGPVALMGRVMTITLIEVHGYAKQGAGFGYSGVRGLNALLATASTAWSAPVIVAQRLRRGAAGVSPRLPPASPSRTR